MAEYTGACIYCGQLHFIKGGEGMTEEQINKAATLECDCEAAGVYKKAYEKRTYAEANVKTLFAEDGEAVQQALFDVIPALAWRTLSKVSITTQEGIKATLTAKEASIKVERTETTKRTLEN